MIGLVIVGVGLTLAVPSFQGMTARNRIATQVNEFLVAVNLARSEASRRGSNVCIRAVGTNSVDQFGDGWQVVDVNNGNCTGHVIRSFSALTGESTLDIVGSKTEIQFSSLGALDSSTPISVDLCHLGQDGRRAHITWWGALSHTVPMTLIHPEDRHAHEPNGLQETYRQCKTQPAAWLFSC